MQNKLARKVVLLLLFYTLSFALVAVLFKYNFSEGSMVSLQLHDTYFTANIYYIATFLLILILNLFLFIYQFVKRWQDKFWNWVQLIVLGVFTVFSTSLYYALPRYEVYNSIWPKQEGWTIYPPLSAIPKEMPAVDTSVPLFFEVGYGILFLLPFLYLIYCGYRIFTFK